MKPGATQPVYRIIFSVILFSIAGIAITSAQDDVDVIYLDNGNVIRGHLIEQPDSTVIRIETLCHNIFQFRQDEITSIRQELLRTRKNRSFTPKETGYSNITDFGLLVATGYNQKNAIFSILTTHNYTFRKRMAAGAGFGLEFFEQLSVPLYASYTWQVNAQKLSPFTTVKAGYSFAVGDPGDMWDYSIEASGGMMLSAGVGTKIWLSHRNALVISLLYRYQGIHSVRTWEWSGETTELLKKYNRLELRFGFQF